MLNLSQLQSFLMVISEGSMTAAADKLYLTQPAISQQIRNLEEELGVELLVRGVRQIKPTLHGEILFDYAKRILQLTGQAEVAVKATSQKISGAIHIGSLNALGVYLLSPVLSRMLRFNSKLTVGIDYDDAKTLIERFQAEELDMLILPDTETEYGIDLSGYEKKFLLKEEMWLVGSSKSTDMPNHIQVSQLNQYPFILLTREFPGFSRTLKEAFMRNSMELRPVFESTNVGTLKRLIESGLGWGFLPASSIRKQVRMGRMNHILIQNFHYQFEFYVYYRGKSEKRPLFEVFYQSLQQQERG